MKKIWSLFKIYIQRFLQYRAEGFIWSLVDIVPALAMLFYWNEAFKSQALISGRTKEEILSYYFINAVVAVLIITHPEHDVAFNINKGRLSNFLVKPISYHIIPFTSQVAYKFNRALFALPMYAVVAFLLFQKFTIKLSLHISLGTVIILLLGFILIFLIKYSFGILAFWFSEIGWIIGLEDVLTVVFSGSILPLYMFPQWFQNISNFMPFQFYVYIPVQALLGTYDSYQQLWFIVSQLVWILLLTLLVRYIWQKGLKKYAAYGG
ncbi:hypothetical protein GYA49_02860 [Candidatus Beckwithbacteria bacterium]|nr:hypothetical protein [Candidatus Beckwithbacteria bacterium]